jgi:hypothetical protein
MHSSDSIIKAADTSSRPCTPTACTDRAVIVGPTSAPLLPPAAIMPNRRRACACSKLSAMAVQNKETTTRLKTLTQTKRASAATGEAPPAIQA